MKCYGVQKQLQFGMLIPLLGDTNSL